MRTLLLCALLGLTMARDDDWQPIVPEASSSYSTYVKSSERSLESSSPLKILNRRPLPSYNNKLSLHHAAPPSDTCSLYKVSLNQELLNQYVEYQKDLPNLKEFTLCMWTKFHNHSQDHPLFSYSVGESPREISSWVSNTNEASYFSMAVHGQTFFRLNYPLKLNTWYHSCQSWNGKTGEWQIWVNAERVGRGFHNRLVGHIIKGGGISVSGQEQSMLYKKDPLDPIKQPGLVGEITMLQLYHVALTAGKAHKDHKHHHAHHFKHDGTPIESATEAVTEPPPPESTPLGNGNFLIGGQLMRAPVLNLAGPQQQMIPVQLPNGLQLQQEYVNGQLGSRVVSEQLLNSVQQSPSEQIPPISLVSLSGSISPSTSPIGSFSSRPSKNRVVLSSSLLNPANVQYIDDTAGHNLFKRNSQKRDKRDNPEKELKQESTSGKKDKRGLVMLTDGSVVDESLLSPDLTDDEDDTMYQQSLLSGLAGVVGNVPVQNLQKQAGDEREPAEAEVKAVMQVCSGCAPEPFKKALVLSWRSTPKKLYSGAHYYKGLPICRAF
ncbi:uncharacterized protein LOC113228407 [Hyposmocoma kahamanoa]|uniref:uncharacterized protein LOC113228407 n=1 Tax=Hyposmocoma kahamanoa TaxID=1477025 RepID=UPI000E6D89BC|nr:uncharacterized protein LOC113228407 [Hyposmocoma kahamanoa]